MSAGKFAVAVGLAGVGGVTAWKLMQKKEEARLSCASDGSGTGLSKKESEVPDWDADECERRIRELGKKYGIEFDDPKVILKILFSDEGKFEFTCSDVRTIVDLVRVIGDEYGIDATFKWDDPAPPLFDRIKGKQKDKPGAEGEQFDRKSCGYYDLMIALMATGAACAAARDELTEEVANWLLTRVAGSAFLALPEAVADKLIDLTEHPPALTELMDYIGKLDEDHRAYFDVTSPELERDLKKAFAE